MVGFHLRVDRVPCAAGPAHGAPPAVLSDTFTVDDGPSAPLRWVGRSAHRRSRHRGVELEAALAPGCYEVLAVPAREVSAAGWSPSAECGRAGSGRIRVTRGRTARAALWPQCQGDRFGQRDVIARLNRPPTATVDDHGCVTASDPDDDPVEVSFAADGVPIGAGDVDVVGFEEDRRLWRICTDLVVPATGSSPIEARVHDLGWSLGRTVRLEELVAPGTSHASVILPVVVDCPDDRCS